MTHITKIVLQSTCLKASVGRGPKRTAWLKALHADLRPEFERLRRLGVKSNIFTFRTLTMEITCNSKSEANSMNEINSMLKQALYLKIDPRWI